MASRDEILVRLRAVGARAFSQDVDAAGNSVEKLGDASLDARDKALRMERATKQAKDAVDRYGKESLEAREALLRLDRAQDRVRGSADGVAKSGSRVRTMLSRTGGIAGLIGGAGAVAAIKSGVDGATAIQESLSKNEQLFGDSATAVERFAANSADSFGISRQAALEYTGVFGNLARGMGVGEKAAAAQSVELTKLAADLASFNNTSVEEALEALRSGLVGESEPLRKFGVSLSATAVEAEALAAGIVKPVKNMTAIKTAQLAHEKAVRNGAEAVKKYGKDSLQAREASVKMEVAENKLSAAMKGGKVNLTERQKAQAMLSLTQKQAATAQGDFARTSDGLANSQKRMNAQFADAKNSLGAALIPALTDAATATAAFIQGMRDGTGPGGEFANTMRQVRDVVVPIAKFLKDNPALVAAAVAAWGTYKAAAKAAMVLDKIATARRIFGGLSGPAGRYGTAGGRSYAKAFRAAALLGTVGIGVAIAKLINDEATKAVENLTGTDASDAERGRDARTNGQGPDSPIDLLGQVGGGLLDLVDGNRAMGGPVGVAGKYLVGEYGPEIVNLPAKSNVVKATDTRRQLASSGGGPFVIHNHVYLDGRIVHESIVRRDQLDEAFA
jgi:hypothetical protein